MLEEVAVLGGQDRLAQVLRNVVVVNDDAALDRKLADELIVLTEHARNRVGRVIVERADFRQVAGIREQDAGEGAQQGRRDKEGDDAGVARVADGDGHAWR